MATNDDHIPTAEGGPERRIPTPELSAENPTVYIGDIDVVIGHHFGDDVDRDATSAYTELDQSIEEAEENNPPVLFVFIEGDDDFGGTISALVNVERSHVEPSRPLFRSTAKIDTDVLMHAFTGERAPVTRRTLALAGYTTTVNGNITSPHGDTSVPVLSHGLALRETAIAEAPHGRGVPSDYAFSNSETDILFGDPQIIIGWNAIESTFLARIQKSGGNPKVIAEISNFLAAGGNLDKLPQTALRLAEIITHAEVLKQSIGRSAVK